MITIKNYCEDEIQFIIDNYQNMTVAEIASKLNKTNGSISNAARKLGLVKQPHKEWTNEEIEYLKHNYGILSVKEISKTLNRTAPSINACAQKLQLYKDVPWTQNDEEYLRKNFTELTHAEMATILHRTEGAVRAKCFDLDLYKKELPWTKEDLDFIRDHYMEMPTSDIAKLLNRTTNAIKLKAGRMGYKKYPYYCDYTFFEHIDTEEKAYWLGFLTADGWISKNNQTGSGCVGIELQYGDIEHLQKFNKSLRGNYKISDRWKTCSISTNKDKENHMCVLRIFSITMYNTLINLGFTSTKSFDSYIPHIPKELIRHYIRGYFDGDGCFAVSNNYLSISFCTASDALSHDIINVLQKEGITLVDYPNVTEYNTLIHRPTINRIKDKIMFLSYIYKDAKIYLDRKYKKYLKAQRIYGI